MLRIINFLNQSTTQIQAQFSSDISSQVGIDNISIVTNIPSIPELDILSVQIDGDTLVVNTVPQRPFVLYTIKFYSTDDTPFISTDGDLLQEDGQNNKFQFVGLEGESPTRDLMIDNLPGTYDTESATPVRNYIAGLADVFEKARHDIYETGNANYISIPVVNESHIRGYSACDRLLNEGAYEVTRVGTTPAGTFTTRTTYFGQEQAEDLLDSDYILANDRLTHFPADPISLREIRVVDEVVSNEETVLNSFTSATVTLSKKNIAAIHSVKLINSNDEEYIYNIPRYGYNLLSNRYDTLHATQLFTLQSNQFKLSEGAIVDGYFPNPQSNDQLIVSYAYIDNGVNIKADTVSISGVRQIYREAVGAVQNIFYLQHYPIVTAANSIATAGGVSFLDPAPDSGTPFTTQHPAFTTEIAYNQDRLPSAPGQFAVNYETGQVFVYGETTADGTGPTPPVASYYYRKEYVDGIDFTFDTDSDELAANSTRDLIGATDIELSYEYERVLAEGVDYLASVHKEVLKEAVDNRLLSSNTIATLNYPITNVFQVLNENTGEKYAVDRWNNHSIQISGRQLPRTSTISSEIAEFERSVGEVLQLTEILSTSGPSQIIKIELTHGNIISETGKYLGSNINSSVVLTDTEIFAEEYYYDNELQDLATNLNKLNSDGDYLIDYQLGIVYVQVPLDTTDLGEISYTYARAYTQRPRIMAFNSIGYQYNGAGDVLLSITDFSATSDYVDISGLPPAGERFLAGDNDLVSILGLKQYGTEGQRTAGSTTFVALDAAFDSSEHEDGYHYIRFTDDTDRLILSVVSKNTVTVDIPFTDSDKSVNWALFDVDFTDGYTAVTNYDIVGVRGVYSVTELQTLPRSSLTNYFDPVTDSFSDNTLVLNNAAVQSLSPGEGLIIDYDFGNLFLNYDYVVDSIRVTYEYGDNQLDFSINNTLEKGDEYYVDYKYGAMRQSLLQNFGSLTQIPELTDFDLSFNRELYRNATKGALQAFLTGPTNAAISAMVSNITDVNPDIRELDFNEWTSDRDNLYLAPPETTADLQFKPAGRDVGIYIGANQYLKYPSEAYISFREGTFICEGSPEWRGIDNDATLTFSITSDGYYLEDGYGLNDGYGISLSDIYIGSSAFSPTEMPFSLNRSDSYPYSPIGMPSNYTTSKGYFIWYDDAENRWKMRWRAWTSDSVDFSAEITTTGEFHNVTDGYVDNAFINEVNDSFYTTANYIRFSTQIDGYDGADLELWEDGIDFSSDNHHYIFDTGPSETNNRISLYKDGAGYLVGRVFDSTGQHRPGRSRAYAISADISDWEAGSNHQVALGWRFNSPDSIDELHLFIDGQEVANNWKFGGKPSVTQGTDLYRTNANEVLLESATANTIGGSDGVTITGSNVFESSTGQFVTNAINIGDELVILDDTADGDASPHTITAILSESQVTVSSPLTLTLENVKWTVNQLVLPVESDIDIERFAVWSTDTDLSTTELRGLDATDPQYSITRESGTNYIYINSGVSIGDTVTLNTLGLTKGRIRDSIYKYTTDNRLRTNFLPPESLSNIEIYKYIFDRTDLSDGSDGYSADGYFTLLGNELSGTFTSIPQPSNSVTGKKLRFTLHGTSNIDFMSTNEAIVYGTAHGVGATSETISFSSYGDTVTSLYFTSINSIEFTFTGVDSDTSFGAIEVIEDIPLTKSENNGDFAEVDTYFNGNFRLIVWGSGGVEFTLEPAFYLITYPSSLTIKMERKGPLYIGSDINGENSWGGSFDEVHILNEMLSDVRTGEEPTADESSVTRYYLSPLPAKATPQSLMLLHFNDNTTSSAEVYKTYNRDYLTAGRSVNSLFDDCLVANGAQFVRISNDNAIIRQNAGTIEFWVSPLIDTYDDADIPRYYIDITSMSVETLTSLTANTIRLTYKANDVDEVRLLDDTGSGINYATGFSLGVDGRTITLARDLPSAQTTVRVAYTPIDAVGDRISIYKDGYGYLNFEIRTETTTNLITYPIGWTRNTWHRIKATYNVNNKDNRDRMRLWVDGAEGGVLRWGSPGLLYGIGSTYGSLTISNTSLLTSNIDISDTLADIIIGNNYSGTAPAMARIDNLRFSYIERPVTMVAGVSVDLDYQANTDVASPVIEDVYTTALFNFDKSPTETEQLSNLLSSSTHLFNFDVNVIDSFDRVIGNDRAESLIRNLLNRIKPAHTGVHVEFVP